MNAESGSQNMHMSPRMLELAEMHPFQVLGHKVNFLQHLNLEDFWVNTRDNMIYTYPQQRVHFVVVWGRTASGKRLARSQLIYAALHDPVVQNWQSEIGAALRVSDIPFSHAVNLAMLKGEMNPNTPRGLFQQSEYRKPSRILSSYVFGELNNYGFLAEGLNSEGPTLAIIEPSGPTAFIHPDQTLEGWDRGLSTVHSLAKYCKDITRVLVITRGHELLEQILTGRETLPEAANAQEVADIIINAHLKISKKGKPADIRVWSPSDLMALRREFIASYASADGAIASNQQTDWLMSEKYHIKNEADFWPTLLDDMGFARSDCVITNNVPDDKEFVLHADLLNRHNVMLEEIRMRKRFLRIPY